MDHAAAFTATKHELPSQGMKMKMMRMKMMRISPFGPVGSGRPLRGARRIHINSTQPFIEAFMSYHLWGSCVYHVLKKFLTSTRCCVLRNFLTKDQ
jgi:hypothetical protein